jgi:uncharacterized membrane protein HdeD (DUF308 family)
MKTALRALLLLLAALVGLVILGRGIVEVVAVRMPGHEDISARLVEGSILIAAGIAVLSVAIEQLNCWRTHHKDDSLL